MNSVWVAVGLLNVVVFTIGLRDDPSIIKCVTVFMWALVFVVSGHGVYKDMRYTRAIRQWWEQRTKR